MGTWEGDGTGWFDKPIHTGFPSIAWRGKGMVCNAVM